MKTLGNPALPTRGSRPSIAVLVPVLARPQQAAPLVESILAGSTTDVRVVFLCSPADTAEIDACQATSADVVIVDWQPGRADFQRKINLGYDLTDEPFLFQAADDISFDPGWDVAALTRIEADGAGVCGTNDMANPRVMAGHHSTHSLIRRSYIDECGGCLEGPGFVFSPAYAHQWCDNELVELARTRGCFTFAPDSIVRHRHPIWRTADDDATYRRGSNAAVEDSRLFHERQRVWLRGAA